MLVNADPDCNCSTHFQAIKAVTSLISRNEFDGLRGLLTARERARLFSEIETEWKDVQRNNIELQDRDLVASVPVRVYRHYVAYQKFADVDVMFVVNRTRDGAAGSSSVFMIIKATFTRDYSQGRLPDWTISKFKLERFSVLCI